MTEHLVLNRYLTPAPHDRRIRETFLGQAHIAGTGPEGKTCRECVYWRLIGKRDEGGISREYVKSPAYFGKRHKETPCELKKHKCTFPIANKANRRIPHDARACRLFEAADNPPPVMREAKK